MEFGLGPDLAAQCARAHTPDGWRPWTDADGPVPAELIGRAASFSAQPIGSTASFPLPGVTVLLVAEARAWNRDERGDLVQGCFRATGIYLPNDESVMSPTPAPSSKLERTVGILTAVSLVVGIGATLWGRR